MQVTNFQLAQSHHAQEQPEPRGMAAGQAAQYPLWWRLHSPALANRWYDSFMGSSRFWLAIVGLPAAVEHVHVDPSNLSTL